MINCVFLTDINSMLLVLVKILKAMFCSLRTTMKLVITKKKAHNLKTR